MVAIQLDGEKGKGNLNVDAQRNRILVAQSLKEAETLASQGKPLQDIYYFLYIHMPQAWSKKKIKLN